MNHFRKILAIAALTVRNAARTRVFVYMLALVVLTIVLMPIVISGDGTTAGYARIVLDYTLSLLTFILAVTSLWIAVGVSSREIEEKQVHLLVTKPVSPLAIWLGKWIGLLMMNAAILLLAGICVSASLRWHLRPSSLPAEQGRIASEEVLTARRVVFPDQSDLTDKVNKRTDAKAAAAGTNTVSRDLLLGEAFREVVREENVVQPGATRKWVFPIGEHAGHGGPVSVTYNISAVRQLELEPVAVEWRVGADGTNGTTYATNVLPGHPNSFPVPLSGRYASLEIRFVNAQTNPPSSIAFNRERGIVVMVPEGSFEGNLARALMLIFCKLAVLSALGLTMGCCFSMPVAVFVACALIAAFNLSGMLTADDIVPFHPARPPRVVDTISLAKFKALNLIFAPIRNYDPMAQLQRGELIPSKLVAEAFAVQILLYSGLFCIIGAFALKRRQLGMPAG